MCHEIPEDVFPIDKVIERLIKLKQSHKHDEAKKYFNYLRDNLNNLIKRDNETFIYDYFKNVELDIELERETLIQKLNVYYDDLIKQLNQH